MAAARLKTNNSFEELPLLIKYLGMGHKKEWSSLLSVPFGSSVCFMLANLLVLTKGMLLERNQVISVLFLLPSFLERGVFWCVIFHRNYREMKSMRE